MYYPFPGNVCGRPGQRDSRSSVSFAVQQIQHALSRSQQSQPSFKAANLDKAITGSRPGRDQVAQKTTLRVLGWLGCTIQAGYIVTHGVLRVGCIIVCPADNFLLLCQNTLPDYRC